MAIVNKETWLRERGFDPGRGFANGAATPASPTPLPPAEADPVEVLTSQIARMAAEIDRQAQLIVQLQGALRDALRVQPPAPARQGRVKRRPRGTRAAPAAPAAPAAVPSPVPVPSKE